MPTHPHTANGPAERRRGALGPRAQQLVRLSLHRLFPSFTLTSFLASQLSVCSWQPWCNGAHFPSPTCWLFFPDSQQTGWGSLWMFSRANTKARHPPRRQGRNRSSILTMVGSPRGRSLSATQQTCPDLLISELLWGRRRQQPVAQLQDNRVACRSFRVAPLRYCWWPSYDTLGRYAKVRGYSRVYPWQLGLTGLARQFAQILTSCNCGGRLA